MKFPYLNQFNKAMLEHNVLNGREARLPKMMLIGVGLFVRIKSSLTTLCYPTEF